MAGQRVPREIVEKAQQRFYPSRDANANRIARLAWAVGFAQEDIEHFTPGRKLDTQTALTAFPGVGQEGRAGQVAVFSESDMTEAHEKLALMFARWVEKGVCRMDRAPSTWFLHKEDWGTSLDFGDDDKVSVVDHLIWRVFALMNEYGDRVRACPAPAKRGKPEQTCGRIYVGRPNQKFCSLLCQNRAGVREARSKKAKGGHKNER